MRPIFNRQGRAQCGEGMAESAGPPWLAGFGPRRRGPARRPGPAAVEGPISNLNGDYQAALRLIQD
jgi:hypothetical protein